MRESSNHFGPRTAGNALFFVVLVLMFVFQFWIARSRMFEQFDGNHDFTSYATLGRGLIETHWLPTFIFPGKTFDGPIKQFVDFAPGILLGYHEWIPVFMIALTATAISVLCYAIARLVAGRVAALVAMLLCGALDPYVARYAFRHAYSFDVMVLLGLSLGWLVMAWGRCVRLEGRQPGWGICLLVGVVAGLYFYAHPTGAAAILAAALFLACSLGVGVFTWRVPVTAAGFFLGSGPFWIYWARYGGVLASWQGYADRYGGTVSPGFFFFSADGYLRFVLSPGGGTWRAAGVAMVLVAGLVMLVMRIRKGSMRAVCFRSVRRFWVTGLALPEGIYIFLLAVCMGGVILSSSGMSQASAGWAYGVELWFWVMIAVACVLGRGMARYPKAGWLFVLVFCGLAYSQTVRGFDGRSLKREQAWEAVKEDAATLLGNGHDKILTTHHSNYILYALGKEPPLVSSVHDPWVRPLAEQVELAAQPAVIAELDEDVHGRGSWQSLEIHRGEVKHGFVPPPTGRVLPHSALDVRVAGDEGSGGRANDDSFSSSWLVTPGEVDAKFLEIGLDRARSICRLVLFSNRDGQDWRQYSSLRDITIEGLEDSGSWIVLADRVSDDGFHWDGPRLFYDVRERHRLDIRFEARTVRAIRLRDRDRSSPQVRRLTELYVFEAAAPDDFLLDVAGVVEFARAHNARRVLCGRFVSGRLIAAESGLDVWRPAVVRGPVMRLERESWPWFTGFEVVGPGMMIVAEKGFSGRIEVLLAAHNLKTTRRDFGAWVAYAVDPEHKAGDGLDLVWNGFCIGHLMRKQAPHWRPQAPPDKVLVEEIAYGDVARLVAVDVSPENVRAGGEIRVRYTWRIPAGWKYIYSRPTVFCHFRNEASRFGDDHLLLGGTDRQILREVLPGELFGEERVVRIPGDAQAGSYDLEIGLHFAGERVRCRTKKYPTRRNAARLPAFTVVE